MGWKNSVDILWAFHRCGQSSKGMCINQRAVIKWGCLGKCMTWAWHKQYGVRGGYYCGLSWDEINFLHRGLYDTMFWIFNEKIVGNTDIQLLQCSAYTKPRTFQLLKLPCQWGAGSAQGAGKGQNQDNWPKLAKGIFHTIWQHVRKLLKLWGLGWWEVIAWELVGHWLVDGEQLCCTLLSLCIYIYFMIITITSFLFSSFSLS